MTKNDFVSCNFPWQVYYILYDYSNEVVDRKLRSKINQLTAVYVMPYGPAAEQFLFLRLPVTQRFPDQH